MAVLMENHDLARSPILLFTGHSSPTLLRIMYKVRGDGHWVHFNVGLSDAVKAELNVISLEDLLATHKAKFSPVTSMYQGVHWDHSRQKWRARICFDGKQRFLGSFLLEDDAARAYDRAAEISGRYVSLCFIL
jgi:hypothetical protein